MLEIAFFVLLSSAAVQSLSYYEAGDPIAYARLTNRTGVEDGETMGNNDHIQVIEGRTDTSSSTTPAGLRDSVNNDQACKPGSLFEREDRGQGSCRSCRCGDNGKWACSNVKGRCRTPNTYNENCPGMADVDFANGCFRCSCEGSRLMCTLNEGQQPETCLNIFGA